MRYSELLKLKDKFYFGVDDLQELFKIKHGSARVLCSRYVKKGFFVRLKKNFYVLNETWENFNEDSLLKIANILQVPSYVSFMTALSVYGLTSQVQKDFLESASLKRSQKNNIKGTAFNYYKLKKQHYSGFIKKDGIFIATKEKAFIDAVYLYSFGKYKFDFNSIDMEKLNKNKLKEIIKKYPERTKNVLKKLCRI